MFCSAKGVVLLAELTTVSNACWNQSTNFSQFQALSGIFLLIATVDFILTWRGPVIS